jgi:predicted  nucleic acid-binding Zn-ribbon protein
MNVEEIQALRYRSFDDLIRVNREQQAELAELRRTIARECRARQAAEANWRVATEGNKCRDNQISELRQRVFEANRAIAPAMLANRINDLERELEISKDREKDFSSDRIDAEREITALQVERDRLKLRVVKLEASRER